MMSLPIVYIDRSDVRPGVAADLRHALSELVAFVEAREPQLISYSFHVDEAASTMTVVAVHPDSASLELHLAIGGPEFRKVGAFISLRLIEVFGVPSPSVLQQLHEKARILGDATVIVRSPDAGFARIPPALA
jgi:quinol monooxygenase YgiN